MQYGVGIENQSGIHSDDIFLFVLFQPKTRGEHWSISFQHLSSLLPTGQTWHLTKDHLLYERNKRLLIHKKKILPGL